MQFNSITYVFVFLPIAVAGWAMLRGTRFANPFVLAVSLVFYASSQIWFLLPLFVTALVDYVVGQWVAASDDVRRQRLLVAFSVVANLSLLAFFKYGHWFTEKAAPVAAHIGIAIPVIAVALPPAISFYTFQSISYTIDIYRKEFKPYRSVVDYLSFVTFFPHLVAGPIMRARDLLPQLAHDRPLPSRAQVSSAIFMILFGLFQKTVIADNMASVVEAFSRTLSSDQPQLAPGLGLLYAYAFAFQIYCDFAGYSLIARGSARLFNVELMRNFATPYFSSNPAEFWRRWHISLSTWLRDYLYISLGGNRGSKLATYRNVMITMLIGGMWHGAGVLFIAWGFWHGALIILYRIVPIDDYLGRLGRAGQVLSTILFFQLVCFGWILFRSSVGQIPSILRSIAHTFEVVTQPTQNALFWQYSWVLLIFWVPMLVMDYAGWRRKGEFPDAFAGLGTWAKAVVALTLFYAIVFFGRRQGSEFIYFAF